MVSSATDQLFLPSSFGDQLIQYRMSIWFIENGYTPFCKKCDMEVSHDPSSTDVTTCSDGRMYQICCMCNEEVYYLGDPKSVKKYVDNLSS